MPARALPRPASPARRPDGRAIREIRQALLRALRGHILAQVLAPRVDRRRLLWHLLPAPPLSRLPRAPPAQERALGPDPHARRHRAGRRRDRG